MYMKKIRLDIVVVALIVGGVVALSLFCNVKTESFRNRGGNLLQPSGLDYAMSNGVPGVNQNKVSMKPQSCNSWFSPLAANTGGRHVPLGENELAIFSNKSRDVFKPLLIISSIRIHFLILSANSKGEKE